MKDNKNETKNSSFKLAVFQFNAYRFFEDILT